METIRFFYDAPYVFGTTVFLRKRVLLYIAEEAVHIGDACSGGAKRGCCVEQSQGLCPEIVGCKIGNPGIDEQRVYTVVYHVLMIINLSVVDVFVIIT
jgi:hypothetical protein